MNSYSCKTCKQWVPQADNPNEGECRNNSPLPAMTKDENGKPIMSAIWPVTQYNDFCSEHDMDSKRLISNQLTAEEMVTVISDMLETQVINLEIDIDNENSAAIGRIFIEKCPTEEDLRTVENYFLENFEYVDISLIEEPI